MLTTKGMDAPHLPESTGEPDSRDKVSHLTRKTPIPKHPKPLIQYPLSHSLDLDSALKKQHPTPIVPNPPEELKQEDFDLNPEEFETETVRCIKTAGQLAPGKLLPTKQQLLISIPFPLDPCKGYPPAKPDSIGAKRFRKGLVPPPTEAEKIEMVQKYPHRHRIMHGKSKIPDVPWDWITQKTSDKAQTELEMCHCPPGWITQDTSTVVIHDDDTSTVVIPDDDTSTVVIPDDEQESAGKSGVEADHPPAVSSVTSETVEQITIYDDEEEEVEKEKEKIRNLKKTMLPSRKSPRVNIPRLDLSQGVKSTLKSKERSAVESIAESAVKKVISEKLSKGQEGFFFSLFLPVFWQSTLKAEEHS